MERTTIQVTGIFAYPPALQVVRDIIAARTSGRQYQHNLMDYNNPNTKLSDVQRLFKQALSRIRSCTMAGELCDCKTIG